MTGSSVAAQEVLSDLLDRSRRSLGRWEERCGDAGRSLEELQERLRSGRFHLAVLGQFKRGKSTLLNALLGADLLPTAVLPLTAIPTLIRWGDVSAAEVRFLDGDRKERLSGSVGELRAFLVRYVSEKENPENRLDVKEVEIAYPSPLLQRGVVLIDTPGIGSTFRHNTETTLGFLSQCDAALFVLSADPPPTEAELAFLDQVRANVPHLVFVLNKVDYLAPEEAGEVERFLRDLLTEKAGIDGETPIFPLSAKKALEARKRGDASLWEESGAETLRRHLIDFSVAEKERALIRALSGKASDIVADVLLSLKLELRSLRLPLEDLQKRLALFEEKIALLQRQRRRMAALLDVEKKEVRAFLEELIRSMGSAAAEDLKGRLRSGAVAERDLDEAVPQVFERLFSEATEAVSARTGEALSGQQKAADELVAALRKTAAELFDIPYHDPQSAKAFETIRRPYWVTAKGPQTLSPLEGVFGFFRTDDVGTRVDKLVLANMENLRWSLLQNANEAFRRFASTLDRELTQVLAATHGAVEAALHKRQEAKARFEEEACRVEEAAEEFDEIYAGLTRLVGESG